MPSRRGLDESGMAREMVPALVAPCWRSWRADWVAMQRNRRATPVPSSAPAGHLPPIGEGMRVHTRGRDCDGDNEAAAVRLSPSPPGRGVGVRVRSAALHPLPGVLPPKRAMVDGEKGCIECAPVQHAPALRAGLMQRIKMAPCVDTSCAEPRLRQSSSCRGCDGPSLRAVTSVGSILVLLLHALTVNWLQGGWVRCVRTPSPGPRWQRAALSVIMLRCVMRAVRTTLGDTAGGPRTPAFLLER